MQHDFYHPLGVHLVSGRRDGTRLPSPNSQLATNKIPTGAWRSVNNFHTALARECYIDELAHELGRDPLELRREVYPTQLLSVLNLVAEKSAWEQPLPEGHGRGLACFSTFNVTPVAQVAEVSVDDQGNVRVLRVVCAVECGQVVNPNGVRAQMEGGIAFGLTAALKAGISIQNGRVEESNFHDYPLLRFDEMPTVETHIVPSTAPPTGIGEMGVPPAAPAVLNAIFDATGVRLRRIPVRPDDLKKES
jgi:isoquinoline 1-oxidoreductase beta subunit